MKEIATTIKNKELVRKRREQIVYAAINLFSKKGFHKTTLRDLAEEAGISHGNIYDYIGSKEDIFYLLHDFISNIAIDGINRSIENVSNPLEKLQRMVRSEFNTMYEWADAVLLIYQETHILNRPLLKKLLKKEREHLLKYELVLEECIKKGLLRESNTRVFANLIKSMIDTWVFKRWDLSEHVTQLEMERSILDLAFHGLASEKEPRLKDMENIGSLEGKLVIFINGGTLLGNAVSSFLLSKKARLAIHTTEAKKNIVLSPSIKERSETVRVYLEEDYGPITPDLFRQIAKDLGSVDIVIQDLGISDIEITASQKNMALAAKKLEMNLTCAQDLLSTIEAELTKKGWGKILYLAPSSWDKHVNPVRYEIVKAGTIALTKNLAKKLAASRINVNCIVPGYIAGIKGLKIQQGRTNTLLENIPMERIGELSDVVEAAYFLISDSSKCVTSQVIEVGVGVD